MHKLMIEREWGGGLAGCGVRRERFFYVYREREIPLGECISPDNRGSMHLFHSLSVDFAFHPKE